MKKSLNNKYPPSWLAVFRFTLVAAAGTLLSLGTASAANTAELISIGIDGQSGTSSEYYSASEIRDEAVSADGRFVAFSSLAENLTDDGEACNTIGWNIFLRDRDTATTSMITCDGGSSVEGEAAITPDGRFIAFRSNNGYLVADDTNGSTDIFVYSDGGLERVSLTGNATCSCGWPDTCNGCESYWFSSHPTISADGRYVAFASFADNLFAGDLPDTLDVFLYDRSQGTTEIISIAPNGDLANGKSSTPSISADGQYVAFTSEADNLGVEDNNGVADIYLWQRETGAMQRVSVASDGGEANGNSSNPVIDGLGGRIVFASGATNLGDSDQNGYIWDVFVHYLGSGETVNLSSYLDSGGNRPAISDDGTTVSFTSGTDDIYSVEIDETGVAKLVDSYMQFSALTHAGEAMVVSGYNVLVPEDTNGDKDVYLLADGQVEPPPPSSEICDDDIDNDGDGLVDCSDRLDCRKDPACRTGGGGGGGGRSTSTNIEICDDGLDNDGDGRIDCSDRVSCRRDPICRIVGSGVGRDR
ncbi:MAG: hypothetical protein ABFR65_00010 [Pseudomonadota bacterium]